MTDLEMTKLCADAMGLRVEQYAGSLYALYEERPRHRKYCPLNSDDQAMALAKRFKVDCVWASSTGNCLAQCGYGEDVFYCEDAGEDLNRAIVECVAKMRATGLEYVRQDESISVKAK